MTGLAACGPETSELLPDEAPALGQQEQALNPPLQDPQQCNLPAGRYAVSARQTSTPNVYDVWFLNNGLNSLSYPAASCKSMLFVWNEATAPVPPNAQTSPSNAIYRLFEGWWFGSTPASGPRRFAVKAIWRNHDLYSVYGTNLEGHLYTAGGTPARLGAFNYIGPGSDQNHMLWLGNAPSACAGQELDSILFGGCMLWSLYLESGTSRLAGYEMVRNANGTCPAGYYCPQLPPVDWYPFP
ncbi:hypothetical protein [Hyalangium rubrum]|uniref:Lipoprotein n=1 Tax=Hyalangium rubrum TaxID=3103134 RepID=A0ABU5H463_9BACT|nr:hypothetical protein [Hyalangium sp. s54d21]MDY7228031.1 hypothetical protein [Hyalangium sp. s54d21]